jgi:hypothetical protein
MNIHELFPELECVQNGDPYLTDIVKADDIITDHRCNSDWLGIEPAAAEQIAAWTERARLSYELAALYAWWALP